MRLTNGRLISRTVENTGQPIYRLGSQDPVDVIPRYEPIKFSISYTIGLDRHTYDFIADSIEGTDMLERIFEREVE